MAAKMGAKSNAVNTQIDPPLRRAVEAYINDFNAKNEHKANIRTTTEAAFKMFLKEKGFWPPPAETKKAGKAVA